MAERKLTIVVKIPSAPANDNCRAPSDAARVPLADKVHRTVRAELLQFKIRDRRDLVQEPLAARLGVSRPTLVRALNRLVEEGLLLRCAQGVSGYKPAEPKPAEIESAFLTISSVLKEIYPPADRKSRRPYCRNWDRSAHLQRAASVANSNDAELIASELEQLLLRAVSRAPDREALIERYLVTLSRVRRVEGELFAHHAREVAQLMRSFYNSRYDKFIEGLVRYTRSRAAVAARLEREVAVKATSGL